MRFSRALAVIGNVFYHFDQALFGLLAPFLAPLFFPKSEPIYALIYMYAMIPLGFVFKLMGVMFFGRLGDWLGRGKVLSMTLIGMAVQSGCMAALPTYSAVGEMAPFLLMAARFGFDFFSAGETTGSSLFLLEQSRPEKRSFMSSLFDASGILGVLAASCLVWLTHSYEEFWRFLFLLGACIGLIGWGMRRLPDDEGNRQIVQPQSALRIFWEQRKAVFTIACVAGFSYANYYLVTTFMNGFLPLITPLTKAESVSLNSLLLGIDILFLPLFGLLSLKVNKERLMLLAILGIMGCSFPLLMLLQKGTLVVAGCVRVALTVFGTCLAAPYHAWVFEKAPESHRYLVGALGTLLGGKFLGAPFPAFSFWLYHQTGWTFAPALPLIALGAFATLSIGGFKALWVNHPRLNKLANKNASL